MHSNIKKLVIFSLLPSFLLATPNAPSDLKLKALSSSSVELNWKDNSNDELGFKILRNDTLIKTVSANSTTFTDVGLTPNTKYKYTVIATDDTIDEPNLTNVHINEVLASNIDIKLDPDFYEFSDYIELKNYSSSAKNISGYTISNKKTTWTIPSGTSIPAHGYLLIWADEKDTKAHALHANFKLSKKKDTVTFKDSSGNTIDKIKYKKLPANKSVKVIDKKLAYTTPSPLAENKKVYTKLTTSTKPTFSLASGIYSSAKNITISAPSGAKIYYTLDGTKPTTSSTLYSSAIHITKSTTIKAIVLESGKVASDVVASSYIISSDVHLPVISISMDSKYLFDDYVGIYVKGKNGISSKGCYFHKNGDPMNFNQDWERPVNIEYIKDNNSIFNLQADISISGQCSRYNKYGKRSFSIELEDEVEYPLYSDKPNLTKINDFKIRTGDSGYKINDILATKLVISGDLDVDYQASQPVQMFINGEYWGIYNIREKKGKDAFKANYPDIDTKKLDVISHLDAGDTVKIGNKDAFNELVDFVENHSLSNSSNYNQIKTMIDINNYIDYMSIMIYSGNEDWIWNNTRWWRERKDGAKWRWMLDDVDSGFVEYDFDSFHLARGTNTFMSKLFNKLLSNSSFKSAFKSRFNELLDTTFKSSNVISYIDELDSERSPYFELETSKWTTSRGSLEQGDFDWSINKAKSFANHRVSYIRNKLNDL